MTKPERSANDEIRNGTNPSGFSGTAFELRVYFGFRPSDFCLSRNDAAGRAVPPHPGPLPRGEGEPFGSAIKGHRLVSFPARSKRAPSPWGDGRGEGKAMFELHAPVKARASRVKHRESYLLLAEDLSIIH